MIEVEYKGKKIKYDELFNVWKSEQKGFNSLNGAKEYIDKHKKIEQKSKLTRVDACLIDYNGFELIEVTSASGDVASYSSYKLKFWGSTKKGRKKACAFPIYKTKNINELINLMNLKEELIMKIEDWKKENKYSEDELAKELGYSDESIEEMKGE